MGLRLNPECSTQEGHAIYDPCAPGSRMGIRACDFTDELADLVDGLHFHTLCEQNSDDLETTLRAVEEKFGKWLFKMNWLNMGGGHHIDIVENNGKILILDTSAACHMPDVLEMPYRPPLKGSGLPGEKPYTYRLSCNTCLAGDVIGEYSFDSQIRIGDRLYFEDMAIYSMVKTNTFNGIPLPSIAVMDKAGNCRMIKEFGYEDFKNRLS